MPDLIGSNLLAVLVLPMLERNGQRDDVDRRQRTFGPSAKLRSRTVFSIGTLPPSGTDTMKLARVFADEAGESHFDDIEMSMTLLDDSPPAKPHYFTQPQEAKAWVSIRCPPDWDGGLHPTPRRQIIICTAGSVRVTTSLGEAREFVPGAAVLLEDAHGKGHTSEVTSDVPFEALAIRLE